MKGIYLSIFSIAFPVTVSMTYVVILLVWFFSGRTQYAFQSAKIVIFCSLLVLPIALVITHFGIVAMDVSNLERFQIILFISFGYGVCLSVFCEIFTMVRAKVSRNDRIP